MINFTLVILLILSLVIFKLVYHQISYYFEHYQSQINQISQSSKTNMWIYWDNINSNQKPGIIELCHQSFAKHCSYNFNIHLLNSENINHLLPELDEYRLNLSGLKICHKVDIYRLFLLYKYGGIYIDSDILVMKNLDLVKNKLKYFDFVGFGCSFKNSKNYGYSKPSNWLMASRVRGILMKNCILDIINRKTLSPVNYHDIGKKLIWNQLNNMIQNDKYSYYHFNYHFDGTWDSYGNWVTSKISYSNKPIQYHTETKNNMVVFAPIYFNSLTIDQKKMTRKQILDSDTNIGYYCRKSGLS